MPHISQLTTHHFPLKPPWVNTLSFLRKTNARPRGEIAVVIGLIPPVVDRPMCCGNWLVIWLLLIYAIPPFRLASVLSRFCFPSVPIPL